MIKEFFMVFLKATYIVFIAFLITAMICTGFLLMILGLRNNTKKFDMKIPSNESICPVYIQHRYSSKPCHIKKKTAREILILGGHSFKSYMDYHKITDTSSPQYKLVKKGTTDTNGFRKVKGRYCVAVGSRFSRKVGTKLDVIFRDGRVLRCILADQKSDRDTDRTNTYHKTDKSILEFLVNKQKLSKKITKTGNVNNCKKMKGAIQSIRVYQKG